MEANTIEKLQKFLIAQKDFLNSYDLIVLILSVYNCRISEILSASWQDFNPDKFLILHGAKGSSNVIIRDREILKIISKIIKIDDTKIFPFISYYNIYKYIKRKYSHLLSEIRIKKNMKVTHAFRYSAVDNIDNQEVIRDILHHRSVKSGKYYTKKIIKK